MNIKSIELVNFKNLESFQQNFEGNVYLLTGENQRGKSSVLQAITMLLTGERDASVLTNGKDSGYIKTIVGDDQKEYEIALKYSKNNPSGTLQIKCDGMASRNKETILEKLNYTDFDADEFVRWSDTKEGRRKQVDAVKKLLPADLVAKIDAINDEIATIKENRKTVNADCDAFKKLRDSASADLPEDWKDSEKWQKRSAAEIVQKSNEVSALLTQKKNVEAKLAERIATLNDIQNRINAENELHGKNLQKQVDDVENINNEYKAKIAELDKWYSDKMAYIEDCKRSEMARNADALAKIESDRQDAETRKATCENWLADPRIQNLANVDFNVQLAEIEKHNHVCDNIDKFIQLDDNYTAKKDESEAMTETISNLLDDKASYIKEAKLPIEGLEFTDDGLILNGVPFGVNKTSDSQNMEVAVKLAIASNPDTKIFKIARGESLGKARMESIVKMASDLGYQGFIEVVKPGQDNLIVETYTEI